MKITIETLVNAGIGPVWSAWNNPDDIVRWNAASDDWHTTSSRVDLREGGTFSARMEARDGSFGFDFEGVYTRIVEHALIEYAMGDSRTVAVTFEPVAGGVKVTETFDAEDTHSAEQQRQGWQAILDRFARYVEAKA
ncbi:SRPBCC family protein [Jeongeupia naejangsanensis]|uniref:SRPBCC family protein n=1 Tax=Jeongeupia naejangsanensis TaxID=613195 RepID=A0ABS2BKG3_9NEIS|nr:SRPBCC family protein [Jeongeupia naejangsanensis]MBM3116102.1 SRPBCC family protein [Jeongeupia naejangsanensis]